MPDNVHFGEFTQIRLVGGALLQRDPGTPNVLIRARLEGIRRRALNLEEPFRAFIAEWYADERTLFDTQGGSGAAPWPALSPRYAAYKARRYPGKSILRRTDRLYSSLTSSGGENVAEAASRTLRFGTRVPYWIYHQLGTSRMPARPPLQLSPRAFHRLNAMVMQHVLAKA